MCIRDSHLGNCDGWCRPEMTEEQYRERIGQAVQLLEGDFGAVEQELTEKMEAAAEALRFEAAAEYRDRIRAIQLLGKRQKVVASLRSDVDAVSYTHLDVYKRQDTISAVVCFTTFLLTSYRGLRKKELAQAALKNEETI